MAITTIKLQKETKERLEKLRESRRESYDDIIRKILFVLNVTRDSPSKAKNVLEKIDYLRERMFEEEAYAESETKKLEAEKKAAKSKAKKAVKK